MKIRNLLVGAVALAAAVSGYASSTNPDAMRAASAVQINTKYSTCIALTKDSEGNVISFHVNGVNSVDANNLLMRTGLPLSTEFTIVTGITKEGGSFCYMLPSNLATGRVVESISQDLVNAGSTSISITKVQTGKM